MEIDVTAETSLTGPHRGWSNGQLSAGWAL